MGITWIIYTNILFIKIAIIKNFNAATYSTYATAKYIDTELHIDIIQASFLIIGQGI